MNNPAISVVMSVYNVEQYIGEAIESILKQTFNDFEFIIVDDASTDNTLLEIKRYRDERIIIIENEKNLKLAASLNKGLRIAKGKYIARMAGDDISDITRFEKQFNFLEQHSEIDICGTPMKLFGAEEAVWGSLTKDAEIKAGLIWGSTMQHGTVLMRMDTIIKHKLFYDETFPVGQDWKYWFDVKDYVVFSNFEKPMYFYRRGQQNITVQFSHQSKDRYAVMHRILLNNIGIEFNEYELKLHQFIIGLFSITPSPTAIKDARAWIQKLIAHNSRIKKYDPAIFKKLSIKHWDQLFFRLVPLGFNIVVSYFTVSGITKVHLIYYLKYNTNKLIGRK